MTQLSNKRLEYDVVARTGKAFKVNKGEMIKVIDVKGGQAADFFAFDERDIREYISAEHTRPSIGRLFPKEGEAFYTRQRRPIMTLTEDHSPGIHDLLFASCNPSRYRGLGVEGWHASCEENLDKAMAAIGVPRGGDSPAGEPVYQLPRRFRRHHIDSRTSNQTRGLRDHACRDGLLRVRIGLPPGPERNQ